MDNMAKDKPSTAMTHVAYNQAVHPQRILSIWRAGPFLYGSNAVSCGIVGGGVNTRRESYRFSLAAEN